MAIDNIVQGREYILAPNAERRGGHRVNFKRSVTRVEMVSASPDSDGDVQVKALNGGPNDHGEYPSWGEGETGWVLPAYLSEVSTENTVPSGPIVVGERVESYKDTAHNQWIDPRHIGKVGEVVTVQENGTTLGIRYDGETAVTSQYKSNTRRLVAAAGPRPATIDEAFRRGNTIRFTVRADVSDGEVEVGCKNPALTDVLPSLVEMTNKTGNFADVTFEAEITEQFGQPVIQKHGVYISKSDALEYFRDVRIVSEAPKDTRPDVTLTMTADQADAVYVVLGHLTSGNPVSPVFRQLADKDGVRQDAYRYQPREGGRGATVVKR